MNSLMIFGAEYVIYLTLIGIFIITWKGQVTERKAFLLTCISLPLVVIIIKTIHIFYFEPRPFISLDIEPLISHQADASFPSRHTSIMSAIAFTYVYFKSRWAPLFVFLMLWVGIARIFAGVHFPVDIVGGIVVGIISLAAALQVKKLIKLRFFT